MVTRISVRNLHVGYGKHHVLEGIDLEIGQPGLISILGPNGVGKTTLMYTLNGLRHPSEGSVLIDGTDIRKMERREIAKNIAYVPQSSGETFSMTVMDTVLMGRYPHSGLSTSENDLKIAAECLESLGMSEFAMRDFDELSAGQHQKVMIARGLCQEPHILMLDEPTSNLDIRHQIQVMNLLGSIAKSKDMTVIVICHDLNIASRFSDRIILLADGGIYADGTSEEVITEDNIRNVYGVRAEVSDVDGFPYVIFHSDCKGNNVPSDAGFRYR